jgi:hypothetical protein
MPADRGSIRSGRAVPRDLKAFFSEEKKQKTFVNRGVCAAW